MPADLVLLGQAERKGYLHGPDSIFLAAQGVSRSRIARADAGNLKAAEGQQLEQQRVSGKMSAEDFQKKSQQFQEKVAALRQTAMSRRQQLQQMQVGAQSQVVAALNATVAEVAKARGISLVLIKGAVLFNLPAFDITPEVLQKLDARLPVVKLSATK